MEEPRTNPNDPDTPPLGVPFLKEDTQDLPTSAGDDGERHSVIARCELTGTPHAPGEARQFIRKHLDGQAHLEDAVLVVSELVTNAVRHSASGAGGTITVTLAGIPGGVRIEVIDEGSPGPGPVLAPARPAWELTESGQGLRLVTEMTDGRWGHYRPEDAPGRVVWAEIPALTA